MGEGGGGQFDRTQFQKERRIKRIKNRSSQNKPQQNQTEAQTESITQKQTPTTPLLTTVKKKAVHALAAGVVAGSVVKTAENVFEPTPQIAQAEQTQEAISIVTNQERPTYKLAEPKPLDIVTLLPSEHADASEKIEKQIKLLKYDINGKVTPHYEQIVNVVRKHRDLIIRVAQEKVIPPEIVLSLVMVENGGGEFEVNKASGAKGMWQLKKDAAEDAGLKVSDDPNEIDPIKDERLDPVKATYAALSHLRNQIDYFEDYRWGVAAYHTGATNIADFIYQWAKAHNRHQALPQVDIERGVTGDQLQTFARYVRMNHLSPHQVLSDPVIMEYVHNSPYLDDDSLAYGYAVSGARKLLEEDKVLEGPPT